VRRCITDNRRQQQGAPLRRKFGGSTADPGGGKALPRPETGSRPGSTSSNVHTRDRLCNPLRDGGLLYRSPVPVVRLALSPIQAIQ